MFLHGQDIEGFGIFHKLTIEFFPNAQHIKKVERSTEYCFNAIYLSAHTPDNSNHNYK